MVLTFSFDVHVQLPILTSQSRLVTYKRLVSGFNPLTADPVEALHFAILV